MWGDERSFKDVGGRVTRASNASKANDDNKRKRKRRELITSTVKFIRRFGRTANLLVLFKTHPTQQGGHDAPARRGGAAGPRQERRDLGVPVAVLGSQQHEPPVHPPHGEPDRGGQDTAEEGEEDPMLAHPEDQPGVGPVPAVADVVGEEAPRVPVVLVLHEDADAPGLGDALMHVLLPDDGEEEGARGIHDGDVGEQPAAVVGLQQLDHAEEERVLGDRAHGVIGYPRGRGAAHPGGVREERI